MPQHIPAGYAAFSLSLKHALSPRASFITGGLDVQAVDFTNAAVRDSAAATMISNLRTNIDTNVTLGPVSWRLGPYPPEALIFTSPATQAGLAAMETPPPNTNVLVALQTGRGGRRGRGRWFLPWALPEGSVDEVGTIAVAHLNGINGTLDDLLTSMAALQSPFVILHSFNSEEGEAPDIGGAPNEVLSATAQSLVGSQRRRLGR